MAEPVWNVDVVVMPKSGVNDPEGEAILGGLRMLGHSTVLRVRAGRLIRLQISAATASDASDRATEMATQLLANPVIEVFEVSVVGEAKEAAVR